MSSYPPSLKTFLVAAKDALAAVPARRSRQLTFVVGNESADLDSLCSALVTAYILSHSSPDRVHIPLSNLPREDLDLRSELGPVLDRASLSSSHLITLSDLPDDLDPEHTEWFLVDHNCLTGPLKKYESRIIGCIDHHVDEGAVAIQVAPRVIETCGSCMSLVVDTFAADWRGILHRAQQQQISSTEANLNRITAHYTQLAQIAIAPILVDTINLTAEAKIRPKDISSADILESELMDDAIPFDQTAYYDAITAAKEDLSRLTLRDVLRKDYKEWEEGGIKLGISCVVRDLDFLLQMAASAAAAAADAAESKERASENAQAVLLRVMKTWAQEQKLDIVSIMTTSTTPEGQFQRYLLVWALTDASEKVVKRFREDATGKLQLQEWKDGSLDVQGSRYAWRQMALDASRKQVAPLFRDAMKWTGANL